MLTCKVGNKIINTIDYDHNLIRKWSKKGILKCPLCNGQMIFRKGEIRVPHFAHKDNCTEDKGYWENETKEHHLGKQLIYKWLKQLYGVTDLKLEAWIPETKQRPDLMFELFGERYVIEYQCTPITVEEYKHREELYKLNGIKSIWILGTENFKVNVDKEKAVGKEIYNDKRVIYYLNPFKKFLIKRRKPNDNEIYYDVFQYKQDLSDFNNFYIENGVIYTDEEISSWFKLQISNYLYQINQEEMERKSMLLLQQRKLFEKIIKEEIKRRRQEEKKQYDNLIKLAQQKIKDKNIHLFNDYYLIKSMKKRYISNKRIKIQDYWQRLQFFKNILQSDTDSDDVFILLPRVEFRKYENQRVLRSMFKTCKSVKMYVTENKIINLTLGKGANKYWDL